MQFWQPKFRYGNELQNLSVMKNILLLIFSVLLLAGASLNDARQANEAYNNGNFAEAEQLYKKAIDANPDNAKLYFNLGNTLVKQGKTEEALRVFEQFKAMTDDLQQKALANYNIGNIYTQNKKWDKALDHFKKALRYRAADEDAKYNYELAQKKKQEQQQQQQNQQNQQGDQNQEQNQQNQQNQQQQQNQNNQNQNQQQKQQNQNQSQQNQSGQQNQNQQQQQGQQQRASQVSKEQAQKILQALEQKEKDLLKEFKKKKTESSNSENDKDW